MFKDLSHKERLDHFQANADGVQEKTYYEELTNEELIRKRAEFSGKSIDISRIKDRKKEATDNFKAELKPIEIEASSLLSEIKTGYREKEGKVFKMVNLDDSEVGFYSEEGNLVESRPATLEERTQLSIHGAKV
ncbi:hypothetical protein KAR91_70600 [Candidatus Pacearchaeota archaeon]|nr:hypothetical protein [Candidatus Pacearchaeota archaeon]